MSDRAKLIRKQQRNAIQGLLPELLSKELIAAIDDKLTKQGNERLGSIEQFVRGELARQDKRAKDIQGFLVREVMGKISDDLHNANITMLAWQEVMQTRLGVTDFAEFNKEVDAAKLRAQAKLNAAAEAKQQEAMAPKAPPAEALATEATPPAEAAPEALAAEVPA